jgi:NADH-ubiquinone oxidoreductase subunit F-like iron-sulfur protein
VHPGHTRGRRLSWCGKCPPCKGGPFQLMRFLNRLETGRGVHADLEALENLCRILPGSGKARRREKPSCQRFRSRARRQGYPVLFTPTGALVQRLPSRWNFQPAWFFCAWSNPNTSKRGHRAM